MLFEQKESGRMYALRPLDSLRGRVLVVQLNTMLYLLDDNVTYKKTLREYMNHNAYRKIEVSMSTDFTVTIVCPLGVTVKINSMSRNPWSIPHLLYLLRHLLRILCLTVWNM